MSIQILNPGILSILVGADRIGSRAIGVGSGGAMDPFAMQVANYLVGNPQDSAVLEMYLVPAEIMVRQTSLISATGNGFELFLNGKIAPAWRPIAVKKDSRLKFVAKQNGGRAYLAVKGGWKAESWLGSFSTHLGVNSGGFMGRALQKNDIFEANEYSVEPAETKVYGWGISLTELKKNYSPPNEIRCVSTSETQLLSRQSKVDFANSTFTLTGNSNRMGFRLTGKPLTLDQSIELVSSPVDAGIVQLLPDGNLIVLMADHQTTGGYPRVASVIKADLPKLAQRNPADKINFKMISLTEAETLWLSRQNQLQEIKKSCLLQLGNIV